MMFDKHFLMYPMFLKILSHLKYHLIHLNHGYLKYQMCLKYLMNRLVLMYLMNRLVLKYLKYLLVLKYLKNLRFHSDH